MSEHPKAYQSPDVVLPQEHKPASKDGLWRLVLKFRGRCVYCQCIVTMDESDSGATRDHVHPYSKGGYRTEDNIVLACKWCNNHKGNLTLVEWYHETALRGWSWPPDPSDRNKPSKPGSRQRLKSLRRRRMAWIERQKLVRSDP